MSAHGGRSSVGADHDIGLNLQLTLGRTGPHPTNAAVLLQQARHLRLHAQLECAMALALTGKKIEEIPLRHEGNEAAARRQTCEVGNTEAHRAKLSVDVVRLVVRQRQELLQHAQLVHQLERRRVDGVAPEIAEEVTMLLEHDGANTSACEEHAQHHAGGPAADDAAGGLKSGVMGHAGKVNSDVTAGSRRQAAHFIGLEEPLVRVEPH